MYEAFYGCEKTPFARTIASQDLYTPPVLEEIAGRLTSIEGRQAADQLYGYIPSVSRGEESRHMVKKIVGCEMA
jgi:hypothetical protein